MDGRSIPSLAPSLVKSVSIATKKKRTVAEGLCNGTWVMDIMGCLDTQVPTEYLELWDMLQSVRTMAGHQDTVCWRWDSSGLYSSHLAYGVFFNGSTPFACTDTLWKAWAPLRCKIFTCLAQRRRCWTADHLQRHSLHNQGILVFCLHSPEMIDHLFVGCVVTAQIWSQFFS